MPKFEVLTHVTLPVYATVEAESAEEAALIVAGGEGGRVEIAWEVSPKFYRSIGKNEPSHVVDWKRNLRWRVQKSWHSKHGPWILVEEE